MTENFESGSEGSDIEVENDLDCGDFDIVGGGDIPDPLDRVVNDDDEWFLDMFKDDDDDDNEDFAGWQNQWVYEPGKFVPHRIPEFTPPDGIYGAKTGPQNSALDYWELYWNDEAWQRLMSETNRYAQQNPPKKGPAWKPVTVPVLKAFTGLCMAMGILRLPKRQNYWRTGKFLFSTEFRTIMARDRFSHIWRYLHLQNNEEPNPVDKLWKVWWLLDHLNKKFRENYSVRDDVTIDESMIKYKGRLSFRQYMPCKPIKWGIKVWALCEAKTGYCCYFQVYSGKVDGKSEKGLAHRVCMDLLQPLFGSNVRCYVDNFYTSTQLFEDLKVRGILACGTVRSNRKGLLQQILPKAVHLQSGSYKVAQKDELSACCWMDTKPVMFLSTFHSPSSVGTVRRRNGASREDVVVPQMVSDYQRCMRGVDVMDQRVGYYQINHRSKKWWRRLYFYVQMVSAHNAYVLAKDVDRESTLQKWPSFQDFLEALAQELVGEIRADRAPLLPVLPARQIQQHTLEQLYPKKRARLHTALSKPIPQRCQEIKSLLDEVGPKDLHPILLELVESIFKFGSQSGWGLERITRSHSYEYHAVRDLLRADGPLLSLLSKFTSDSYFKYEFPVSCLPVSTQRMLSEGAAPQMYADKVLYSPSGRLAHKILLNPLELYLFHFAYFLVNSQNVKQAVWSNPSEALFPILLEDYLNFFLPLDNSTSVQSSQKKNLAGPKSPLSMSYLNGNSFGASPGSSRQTSHLSFIRSPVISPQNSPRGDPMHGMPQTWKSQMFLQILIEFWLNHSSAFDKFSISNSSEATFHGYFSHFRDPYHSVLADCSLPSLDHVRVVRMLVKHLHYFANSAMPEVASSPYSSPVVSPWDDFKRQVVPCLFQKKLYSFMKHSFDKWPLDASFRQMLETWLSFIQPWRYMDPSQSNKEKADSAKDKPLDEKWRRFVMDNLPMYTQLVQKFLYRALRMDLASPRNAYLVFRVAKVFSLPGLRDMIEEAEEVLHESLHFSEWEGIRVQFKRLFDVETIRMAEDLLDALVESKLSVSSGNKTSNGGDTSWASIFGLGSPDYNAPHFYSSDYDDISYGDSRKLEVHLDQAATHFAHFFRLKLSERREKSVQWGDQKSSSGRVDDLAPDTYVTEDGQVKLSPLGRYQLMNGLRRFDVEYKGDPELQPIRSYESAVMVRLLFALATYINTQFGDHISQLYHRPDFLGSISRQIFSCRAPKPDVDPEPYLSLRWVGSYQNMGYAAMLYLFLYMWYGIGPFGFLFLAVCLFFFTACFKAVLPTAPKSPQKTR